MKWISTYTEDGSGLGFVNADRVVMVSVVQWGDRGRWGIRAVLWEGETVPLSSPIYSTRKIALDALTEIITSVKK
jgi:hypothetical protein